MLHEGLATITNPSDLGCRISYYCMKSLKPDSQRIYLHVTKHLFVLNMAKGCNHDFDQFRQQQTLHVSVAVCSRCHLLLMLQSADPVAAGVLAWPFGIPGG